MKPPPTMYLSIIGLVTGVIALGLAIIPSVVLRRHSPVLSTEDKSVPSINQPIAEPERGIAFKSKNWRIQFGRSTPVKEELADVPKPPEQLAQPTNDSLRWLTMSAVSIALIGIVVSGIGHAREKQTLLTWLSLGCCIAAITWQYVAIGIALGVGCAVFLVVVLALASAIQPG